MFCPQCRKEYGRGVVLCTDCNVPVVEDNPEAAQHPEARLVKVFATDDPGLIAFAKSLLDEAALDYMVRGEGLRNLGIPAFGPTEFWVLEKKAEQAMTLLEPLREPQSSPLADPATPEEDA